MAEQAIYDQLSGFVTALDDRIYPLVLPQDVKYPAAVYQRVSAIRYSAFGGDVTAAEATIQVDIYDRRSVGYGVFRTLTEACRNALQRQTSGAALDMMIEGERDEYEDDTELLRKSFDIRVWYRET